MNRLTNSQLLGIVSPIDPHHPANEKGWIVTSLNPVGCSKPQHGIVPTDHTQSRAVTITAPGGIRQATEWFTGDKPAVARKGKNAQVEITIPAAGVRVVELQ